MQSCSTAQTDLPDLCREAPAGSGGSVAVPGGKKRSSSTCVGGGSTTPSSKSLSSSVDVEDKSSSSDEQCGWGPVQPRCCQVFRNTKVVLFFLCCLATIQVSSALDLLRNSDTYTFVMLYIRCMIVV